MRFTKKSDWANTSLNPALATELQRMDDGIQANADASGKVANNLVVKLNNGTTEGTDKFTFDGSNAKTVNLTPATMYGIIDGGVAKIPENSTGNERHCLIADAECAVSYHRVNQTFMLSWRDQAILLTVSLTSANSTLFTVHRVQYVPLTKGYSAILDKLSAGIVNVSDTVNKFELWYAQPNFGSSLNIIPLGRNVENRLLNFYSYAYNEAASSESPTFDTDIVFYNATSEADKLTTARKINGVSFDGTYDITITANPTSTLLTNQDLDTMLTPGLYYAGGNNTCSNKPDNVDAFGLSVYKVATGYTVQELVSANTATTRGKKFFRSYDGSEWGTYQHYYSTQYPQTDITGNAGTATKIKDGRLLDGMLFDGTANVNRFCVCDSEASANPKVVTLEGFQCVSGAILHIKFSNGNTATPTPLKLTVNGSTYQVILGHGVSYKFLSSYVYSFMFNGTSFDMLGTVPLDAVGGYAISTVTSSSNKLPVAKIGSWTPSSNELTLNNVHGRYIKIGSYVHCWFYMEVPAGQTVEMSNHLPTPLAFYGLPYSVSYAKTFGNSEADMTTWAPIGSVTIPDVNEECSYLVTVSSPTSICMLTSTTGCITDYSWSNGLYQDTDSYIQGEFSYITDDE